MSENSGDKKVTFTLTVPATSTLDLVSTVRCDPSLDGAEIVHTCRHTRYRVLNFNTVME